MGFARHRQKREEEERKKQEQILEPEIEIKKQEQILETNIDTNKPTRQVNMRVPTENLLVWSSECKAMGLTLTDYLILRIEKGRL